MLRVHCDGAATGKVRERDAMRLAAEAQLDAVVDESFPLQALADAASSQQIDGALLQHTGAQGGLDLGPAARFEDYGFDSREVQQVREVPHRPGGAGEVAHR